jgi:hypothetical protein
MAKQAINIGSSANDGAGDPLRTAFTKINENFTEVYTELGGSSLSNISITGNTIGTDDTNGNITLSPNGTGAIVVDTSKNLKFTTHTDNAVLKFDASGNVVISSVVDDGTTVTMGDIAINGTTSTLTTTTNDINLVPGGGEVNVSGHILSDTTNTKDLGSTTNVWRSIFGTKLTATGDRINIATTHTPASAQGAAGDLAGDVAIDASYIYYCTAAHDGSTAIWKKVALAAF